LAILRCERHKHSARGTWIETARTSDQIESVPLASQFLATGEQTVRPAQNDPFLTFTTVN
jgi:hypothetical protein